MVVRVRRGVVDAIVEVLQTSQNKVLVVEFHHDASFVVHFRQVSRNLDLNIKVSSDLLPMERSIHPVEIVHSLSPAIRVLSGTHYDFGALEDRHPGWSVVPSPERMLPRSTI